MKIILNVFRNGECARIIAVKDEKEEGFSSKNSFYPLNCVEIWHTNWSAALNGGFLPTNRDEDYFVEFEVDKPFNEFCVKFEASSYNNPKKYGAYTHNCAYAARFALELVGIKLELSWFKFNRFNPGAYLRIPGVLTPYEVFLAAKKYKTQLLQVQKPLTDSIYAKLERAKSSLQNVTQQVHSDVKKDVDIIISEIDKRMLESPHHAESYLQALIRINELLIQSIGDLQENQQEFVKKSAAFFQKRQPSLVQWHIDEYILSFLALSVCLYYASKPFEESINNLPLVNRMIVGSGLGALGAGFSVLLAYFLRCKNQKLFTEENARLYAKVDTDLSKAMVDLIEHEQTHRFAPTNGGGFT